MITVDEELGALKVAAPLGKGSHNGQKLLFAGGVVLFCRCELARVEADRLAILAEHCCYGLAARVGVDRIRLGRVSQNKHWSCSQGGLQILKRLGTSSGPVERGVFVGEGMQGGSTLGKLVHKAPVVACKTQKGGNVCCCRRCRPVVNGGCLRGVHTEAVC